jgi:hypothetical protein
MSQSEPRQDAQQGGLALAAVLLVEPSSSRKEQRLNILKGVLVSIALLAGTLTPGVAQAPPDPGPDGGGSPLPSILWRLLGL